MLALDSLLLKLNSMSEPPHQPTVKSCLQNSPRNRNMVFNQLCRVYESFSDVQLGRVQVHWLFHAKLLLT